MRRVFLFFAVTTLVLSVVPALGAEMLAPICHGEFPTHIGDADDNVLTGTSGRDVFLALGGDDTIYGLGGNDIICAGTGADRINGGSGHDIIFGGAGPDVINGRGGRDAISGGRGRDTIKGGSGRDVILGNSGRDTMRGNSGDDYIRGDGGTGDIANGGRDRDWCKAESEASCEGPAGPWRVRATGIGNIDFGTPTDFALVEIALLGDPMLEGAPDEDSGWIGSFNSPYGVCPGTHVRMARWGNLRTFFTRNGIADEGEFFTWQLLGTPWGYVDQGLATRTGLRVNDTRAQLDLLSNALTVVDDEIFGWHFYLGGNPSGVSGNLSSGSHSAKVTFIQGGIGCGE